mmetsp:Transcript_24263/g.50313  ORF Transcript_24263/g.50313 Transcript_24263/m.50313 type:complete len:357 (+) Transcript_24263:1678-2748(+)
MRARVPSIPQDKQLSRRCVEDRVDRDARVGTAKNGTVRRLVVFHQRLAHGIRSLASSWGTGSKALVALLQHRQRQVRRHPFIRTGAHTMQTSLLLCDHGRWDGHAAVQQFFLQRRLAQKLHRSSLQMVNATLDLNLSSLDHLADTLAEAQEKVHGVEHVHLHSMSGHFIRACPRSHLLRGFLGHGAKILKEPLQSTSCCLLLSWLRQRVQVAPGCSINGTTLGVAKDQNQTAAELFGAELQTANHGSLCMRAGVSGVPQHENVTWHGVENGFQRRAGISAANDGGVRRLAILHQLLTCCLLGLGTPGTAIHEATVAVLQQLHRLLRGHGWIDGGSDLPFRWLRAQGHGVHQLTDHR